MERRQDAEWFSSGVTKTSGSLSSTFTSVGLSPSHSDSRVGSTSTGIPSPISQPFVETSSSSSTSLAVLSGSPSSSVSAFLLNKGAMAGVFGGLGVLILGIFGIVCLGWIRKRQRYSKQQKSRDMRRSRASVTFSTIMRRFDADPTNRGSEPHQRFSIQQTIPRSAPSHRISVPNVSTWWARRRERRSSQFPQMFYHSRPPSVIDADVKHLGEETQWTLGKVLENQGEQVITPLPPIKRPKPARGITRALSSRGRRSVAESEGGNFTMEDALLPSIYSPSAAYELGSSRSGRHPYAQA